MVSMYCFKSGQLVLVSFEFIFWIFSTRFSFFLTFYRLILDCTLRQQNSTRTAASQLESDLRITGKAWP